jgi:flagellar biosynthesis/type III secretory pathway chaperone
MVSIKEQLIDNTTFLVGNKKNAGKTTFLNYALNNVREAVRPAFLTIGIDGETSDLIFETPKPKVCTKPGDYIITSESMISKSDALFDIIHVFPYKTVLGRLVLATTLRTGNVELVGSEDNSQLTEILTHLKEIEKINTIIVDGAASRTTQVASVKNCQFYYIMVLDQKTFNSDYNKFKTISLTNKFKAIEDIDPEDFFEIKGALTETKLSAIPKDCKTLKIDDFTKIFLDYNRISDLSNRLEIVYETKYKLASFVLIFKDVQRKEFESLVKKNNIKEPILYNPYEY